MQKLMKCHGWVNIIILGWHHVACHDGPINGNTYSPIKNQINSNFKSQVIQVWSKIRYLFIEDNLIAGYHRLGSFRTSIIQWVWGAPHEGRYGIKVRKSNHSCNRYAVCGCIWDICDICDIWAVESADVPLIAELISGYGHCILMVFVRRPWKPYDAVE